MPAQKHGLKDRLSRYREIKTSVIGRRSGSTILIPVWFVLAGDNLYLLPVQGSDTQWYHNVLKNRLIRIEARGVGADIQAVPVTQANAVKSVVEKFRETELKSERDRIDRAISALESVNSTGRRVGRPPSAAVGRKRRGRMSAAARRKLSRLLKQRWAQGKMKPKRKAA